MMTEILMQWLEVIARLQVVLLQVMVLLSLMPDAE